MFTFVFFVWLPCGLVVSGVCVVRDDVWSTPLLPHVSLNYNHCSPLATFTSTHTLFC